MLLDLYPYRFGAGTLRYWTGSEWLVKPLYMWDGNMWKYRGLKYFNGTEWT